MRLLNLMAFFFAVACALFLYALNYDTRRLEEQVDASEKQVERARNDIAVLKAERSHLSRPERIDPLARQLGLGPPRPDQFVTPNEVSQLR
jgi:cell division protein FtsL